MQKEKKKEVTDVQTLTKQTNKLKSALVMIKKNIYTKKERDSAHINTSSGIPE